MAGKIIRDDSGVYDSVTLPAGNIVGFAGDLDPRLKDITIVYRRINGKWTNWLLITQSAALRSKGINQMGVYALQTFQPGRQTAIGRSRSDRIGRYTGITRSRHSTEEEAIHAATRWAKEGKVNLLLVRVNPGEGVSVVDGDPAFASEPFLYRINDPTGTGRSSNAKFVKNGYCEVTRRIPAADLAAGSLAGIAASEVLVSYGNDNYWRLQKLLGSKDTPYEIGTSTLPTLNLSLLSLAPTAVPPRGGTVRLDEPGQLLLQGTRAARRITRASHLDLMACAAMFWQNSYDGFIQAAVKLGESQNVVVIKQAYEYYFEDRTALDNAGGTRFFAAVPFMFLPLEYLVVTVLSRQSSMSSAGINLFQADPETPSGHGNPCYFDVHIHSSGNGINDARLSTRLIARVERWLDLFWTGAADDEAYIQFHQMFRRVCGSLAAAARPVARLPNPPVGLVNGYEKYGGGPVVELWHGGTMTIRESIVRRLSPLVRPPYILPGLLTQTELMPDLVSDLRTYLRERGRIFLPTSRDEQVALDFAKRGSEEDLPLKIRILATRTPVAVDMDTVVSEPFRCHSDPGEQELLFLPGFACFLQEFELVEHVVHDRDTNAVVQRLKILHATVTLSAARVVDPIDDPVVENAEPGQDPHHELL